MDKEKLITVAIGLAVGILAAGGYFAFTKYLPNLQGPQDTSTFTPPASPQTIPEASLTTDLDDYSSTTEADLQVSGKAKAGAKLVFFANADEKIASADATGNFATTLKLEEGENVISVTAFDNSGKVTTLKRSVTLEISQ